ncbi:MAG: helicase [Adhaeribacter sp.]|nr:helicase [Adhaeribacter sp.]
MSVSEHPISAKLEAARRELLDLSLRNPLLNYRPLKARGVEVVNEIPATVFRILVKEGKAMSFLPINAKTAVTLGAPALEIEPEEEAPTPEQSDNKLQTKETPARLDARLLDTYHSARMFVEEQGVSILYLALGTLTWYETETSTDGRPAPLILVPVELERTTARERFQVRYSGGEIGSNLSLIARMKADFDIILPELPETEEINVGQYFDEVWRRVVGRKGWVINSKAISLGFFSFGKFMMYNDLDEANWPDTVKPHQHRILKALLLDQGFTEPASHIPDDAHLDEYLAPTTNRQVVDADSSQTLAILDVNQGRNLVIQGPPGTGKSQTITNLISEALGQGKTVLFVAEKMAALEVVKRRLDKVGLGVACLELHSHKTNKKDLLQELSRTLELGKPKTQTLESDLKLLEQVRSRLNDYADAVNTPVGVSELTVYTIFGRLMQLRKKYTGVVLPRLVLPAFLNWTFDEFKSREVLVEETQARLQQIGQPTNLLFWGSGRRTLMPSEQNRLEPALEAALSATQALREAAGQLAQAITLPAPETILEAETLSKIAYRLQQRPPYQGIHLLSEVWLQQSGDLHKLIAAGKQLTATRQRHEGVLLPEAWEAADILPIRQDLLAYGTKWWRFFSGAYRQSKKKLTGYTQSGLPTDNAAQLDLVNAVLEAQRQQKIITQYADLGKTAFGTQWQAEDSSWDRLDEVSRWATALHQAVEKAELPAAVISYLVQEPSLGTLKPLQQSLENALREQSARRLEITQLLQLNDRQRFGENNDLRNPTFREQEALFLTWRRHLDELHQAVAWNNLTDRLQEAGLQEIINLVNAWPEAGQYLTVTFAQTWLEALLEKAYEERPALLHFERASHEEVVEKFKNLDNLMLAYNQTRLAALHYYQLPLHEAGGQLGILRREFEKKARHLPIRQLMAKAGKAIQTIKPVFMMGPLSIANFLPPESLHFDLVIFDEASQVKPVDALGAILRAGQVVVVGDSRQMPPTSFFDALVKEEEVEEENITADVESILGLFSAQGAPQRMLRWHYRSRHESLIAVSNQEFYENRLVIFPSPDAGRTKAGLVYHHLADTFYDRGKTRTNPKEAERVAAAVMEHARTSPGLSLGVAAFSMAQMQAIINHLEIVRREEPALEAFFMGHPNEPFFIKNLENVQGDERDVIFISIGYGRTEDGQLAMSFGPLNGVGGERRLNVLITRARLRCEVFTNLSADDIDLTRTQARGVQAFKTFLSYAQNGQLPLMAGSGEELASPFEVLVYETLTQAGYEVVAQVGSVGFYIDLAVVHPQQPGRYLLGIVCDGNSYNRARTARDRDRLRQLVLEGLGWQIYRVWSTDWFRNPEAEQKRLLRAVQKALQENTEARPAIADKVPEIIPAIQREEVKAPAPDNSLPLYQTASLKINTGNRELHEVPAPELANWVQEVVQVESPVHQQEVLERLVAAAGINRLGLRLRLAVDTAVALAVQAGKIKQFGEFLWLPDMQTPPLRDRSTLPSESRDINLISPVELSGVIRKAVGDAFALAAPEIAPVVARLLGFSRCTDNIRERVDQVVEEMLQGGKLVKQGEHLLLPRAT